MNKTERLKGLYVITDRPMCLERSMSVDKLVALAISGGARIIQYRNKQSPSAVRLYEAAILAKLCKQLDAIFIINDDVDIALEVDADGVHLGQEDLNKIIGITCHNDLQLAREAEQASADYVALGRFFGSSSKPSAPPASLDTLHQAVNELSIPVCAIGGITPENAPKLIEYGAHMLAVINGVFGTWNVTQAAKAYTKLFEN